MSIKFIDKNVSKNFVIDSVLFVRCPSEYNKNVGCNTCDLCSRKNRNFVIVFYGHGSKKKLVGDEEQGGCYGTYGRVRLQWEHTRKNVSENHSDKKTLYLAIYNSNSQRSYITVKLK